MAIPQNKGELLAAIVLSYEKLGAELATVIPEEAAVVELEGHAKGTLMSVHNLVAYLVGWGELVLKWETLRLQDEPVDFPETGFGWNELGRLAGKFYDDYHALPFTDLCTRLDTTVALLKEMIDGYDDAALYGEPWYGKWSLGRMIQLNTSSPYGNARRRLRAWKRAKRTER